MTAPAPARIFISYATKDGAAVAAKLRLDLEAQGFSIWQDIAALQGSADWWTQIEHALRAKEMQHFILVVTPEALESHVVRREIRLAKQEGKTISPVRGPGLSDLSKMPRWLGNLYDLDVAERRTNLIRVLEAPSQAKRVPMMAPEPPADFVDRPNEFDWIKARLLNPDTKDAVAITAALRGAGGYGKTTLAKALAHDPDIQDAYFDGILWVELGERGGERVLALISDLVALIEGAARTMTTIEAARTALGEALGNRRNLLLIDDVWQKHHLDPFLHGGRNTTRLVTTRFDKELPDTAVRRAVDAMQASEALQLLVRGLPEDQAKPLTRELADLATKLHDWAQLLKLANGFLRDRVTKHRQPLARAIEDAEKRLVAKGLPAFDDPKAKDYEGRHKSVAAAIGINLELLDADKRARFGELGIFPEDADIPIGIVGRLWGETGGLDEFATEDLLSELYGLSLLINLDLDRRTLRFHDTTRHFLQQQAGKDGLAAQHMRLIHAMGDMGGEKALPLATGLRDPSPAETDYFYRHLPSHLADAGDRGTLDALLLDPGWLQAKLLATSSPQALVADYEQHGVGTMQNFVGRTVRLTAGICARDQRQLLPQLLGRLMSCADPAAPRFLAETRRLIVAPTMLPQRLSLTPPGAETARLEGHSDWVRALAVLPHGRLASGSDDHTIRLWDTTSGAETARLEGHAGGVGALAVLPDGRLASGSDDSTIRLWDTTSGAETARLEGHAGGVRALAVLPDGRLASGSDDSTIRLWDTTSGAETARLEGHSDWVGALAVLPDGRLASGGDDTIRLWDATSGAETARLDGHARGVRALAVLPDGRLASGSYDSTIRLWDTTSGAETGPLEGHSDWVGALAVLPDGRLASGSDDHTIRLWDATSGAETARLDGHSDWVGALAVLPDGRLASGSGDNTIRLWEARTDARTGAETARLESHSDWVRALAVLPHGRLASGSDDSTIRLWDTTSGAETARLEGHAGGVGALAVLPDGRLASGCDDNTIRLWDARSGAETTRLDGHSDWVRALTVLPDGRLASGSDDSTIRLWDTTSGAETGRLERHAGGVWALAVLPDGRLASGSDDHTIRLWDTTSGAERARLEGHAGGVWSLAVLPDSRLASGSDDSTIRLWDTTSGAETGRLEGRAGGVWALAVLPDRRLASGSDDHTIRLWDVNSGQEFTRLEVDAAVLCLAALPEGDLVAGDAIGRVHWLKIVG